MTLALNSSPYVMQAALSSDDRAQLTALENKIMNHAVQNRLMRMYYEGNHFLTKIGFSIPPSMREFKTVVGWPAIVVDVIEERLRWKGWYDLETAGNTGTTSDIQTFFDELYVDNNLESESPMNHLDSLMFGVGFASIGTRDPKDLESESPLITTEATEVTTGLIHPQKRRFTAGAAFRKDDEGNIMWGTYMTPDTTIYLRRQNVGGAWYVDHKDEHNLGRVPLVPFINRPMGSRREGRSEITKPIRGYTDIGVRTILGMETNREFFSSPQRYALGATEDDFVDEAGNKIPAWQSIVGRLWGIGRDEDGELPEVGQWDPAPARPYLEQLQGLAQLVAADGAVPQTYLGFMSDNPASGDSIRALESRLIKRSERRITSYSRSWKEVGHIAWLIKNPSEKGLPKLDCDWGNPATPTQQADADATMKLVSAGILPPTSVITRNRIGLSKSEQLILDREQRAYEAKQRMEEQRKQAQAQKNALEVQNARQGAAGGAPGANGGPSSAGGTNGAGPAPRPSGGRVPGQRDYAR
jgi:hypothetical protein